ncbi:MAG: 30S ribosomal protein S4 [Candidatus Pacearchaeota archaeon]|nr:30S ribosomal protein S4 [Candidatus Pacearchaeota archaeon]
MIRKKKDYGKPRKMYDKFRIEEENKLLEKYGLKNKREIWRAEFAIAKIRRQAKNLITAEKEKQEELLKKLNKQGFNVENIAGVLALNKEDWLKRRLQSIIIAKGYRPKDARQMITHKHVAINDRRINVPGRIIAVDEEDKIKVLIVRKIVKPNENKEMKMGEVQDGE